MSRGRQRHQQQQSFQAHKIEEEIENFVQNFKRNNPGSVGGGADKDAISLESGESSGLQSSLCSTDEYTDDSPEDFPSHRYLLKAFAARNRKYSSNTSTRTSVSEDLSSTRSGDCSTEWTESDGYVMGEIYCPHGVLDVAELLQAKFAFISGGKAKNGAPILTFPDNPGLPEVTDEQYQKVISYLCSVPALVELEKGFVIVVDRRNDGWGAVKTILLKLAMYFPTHIQVVFLLQPMGFFQRAFADFRSKFVKEELEFKVVMCNSPSELHQHIDRAQLTKDVGGDINYDYNEWIEQRAAIEKFSANTISISQALKRLAARFEETEVPNDVAGTETLIKDHIMGRKELLEDLTSATKHGETLLSCIKGVDQETSAVKIIHVVALERLLIQLEERKLQFDVFWVRHEQRLQQCLQLRQFEEEFKLLQYGAERNLEWLQSSVSDVGDSYQRIETLIFEFEDFGKKALKDTEHAERLHQSGEQLIKDDHYAVDSIRPKCIELQCICDQYKQLLRQRREHLNKSLDLHVRIDRANKWCTRGVDLLANQQIEKCQTQGGADCAMRDIEHFLATAKELKLNNPKEFRMLFDSVITPETRVMVQQVLKRIEDVQGMCEKRMSSLQKHHAEAQQNMQQQHQPKTVASSSESLHKYSARNFQYISSDADMQDRQRHVFKELIDTEKTYVAELHDILWGYYYELDNKSLQHLIPSPLKEESDVLFGNLADIYVFHNDLFLQELQSCRETPAKVGKCFVNRMEEFQMYSIYCQNKPRSENLRTEVGDDNPFFKECQRRLGHKLPLGAYLLKPVQRITKYQLLLKEMLKYTENDPPCYGLLQDALNAMLSVIKYVNDIMHQVSIVGFEGKLEDQGKLLMQDSFNMWTEHKKDKIRDFRFKPMQRHMFLYEKSILLSKKKDDNQTSGKAIYIFKTLLKTSQVGLTENVKGDKKKFELWLRGREEVYIFQAHSVDLKDIWVKEIKKVLLNQFDKLRVHRLSISHKSQEDISKLVRLSESVEGSSGDSWRTRSSISQTSSSSGPTIPIGLEMNSPLESPPGMDSVVDEGWSSGEFSNSEEEENFSNHLYAASKVEPSYLQQFSVLADYMAMDEAELNLQEGDIIEILRIGNNGWWYAHHLATHGEGWVPSTYLEPAVAKRPPRSSTSSIDMSVHDHYSSTKRSNPYREYLTGLADETTV